MRDFALLYKLELKHLLHSVNPASRRSSGEKNRKRGLAAIMIFSAFLILFYSVSYCVIMAKAFIKIDALWLLPAFMFSLCSMLMLFTTVYKVKGTVFGFDDYDFLMALPVKTSVLVLSRLAVLYSFNFTALLFILIPAAAVYAYYAVPGFYFYISFLVALPFVPMIPIGIAGALGTLIHLAASRFKHKRAVNMVLTLLLFSGLIVLSFNTNVFIENVTEISQAVTGVVNRFYPPAALFTNGVCKNNFSALFLFIAVSAGFFWLFSFAAAKKFKALNTLLLAEKTDSEFKVKEIKTTPVRLALYKRELQRYFSSVPYVLNTGMGLVLFTLSSAALLIMGKDRVVGYLGEANAVEMFYNFGPIAVSFFVVLSCTTASSISLEGKNLWIIKSLPLDPRDVFLSKIALNLSLSVPAVIINSALTALLFRFPPKQAFLLFALPLSYAFLTALGGLALNLMYPNFDWSSEVTVIKQSASVTLAVFIGMGAVAVPLVLLFIPLPISPFSINCGVLAVVSIADLLLYRYIITKGPKIFAEF